MAFIIDTYNKFNSWDRTHSVYKFEINGNWYAIKEVELEWGLPKLPLRIDANEQANSYFIYNSREEAMQFVQQIKSLN